MLRERLGNLAWWTIAAALLVAVLIGVPQLAALGPAATPDTLEWDDRMLLREPSLASEVAMLARRRPPGAAGDRPGQASPADAPAPPRVRAPAGEGVDDAPRDADDDAGGDGTAAATRRVPGSRAAGGRPVHRARPTARGSDASGA